MSHAASMRLRAPLFVAGSSLFGLAVGYSSVARLHLLIFAIAGALAGVGFLRVWKKPGYGLVALATATSLYAVPLALAMQRGASPSIIALARYWKEGIIALLLAKFLASAKEWDGLDRLVLGFLAVTVLYVVAPIGPSLFIRVQAARIDALFLLIFFLVRHLDLSSRVQRAVQNAVLATGALHGALALWNYFSPAAWSRWTIDIGLTNYYFHFAQLHADDVGGVRAVEYRSIGGVAHARPGALLVYALNLAFFLLVPTGVAIGLAMSGKIKSWHLAAGGLAASGVLVSLTRSAIAAIPLMVGLALAVGKRRGRLGLAVAAAAIVLLPLASAVGLGGNLKSAFDPADASVSAHIHSLRVSAWLVGQHPFGRGLGTSLTGVRYDVENTYVNESWYFQIASELGVMPAILYIAIVVSVLLALARRAPNSSIALGALCALSAIAVAGVVLPTLVELSTAWTVWLIAGLALRPEDTTDDAAPATWGASDELDSAATRSGVGAPPQRPALAR